MSQFQVKYFGEDSWEEVSEKIVLEKLVDEKGRIVPFLTQMLQGLEIITTEGIF